MVRGAASRWPAAARIAFTPANTPQGRYNPLILRAAEQGNLAKALNLARQLRELSPVPSLETYEAVAKAFAVHGLSREALRVINDAEAAGIVPDIEVWNQVISAHVNANVPLGPLLKRMEDQGIQGNRYTGHLLVQHACNQKNLEGALNTLFVGSTNSATPTPSTSSATRTPLPADSLLHVALETVSSVVELAASVGETTVAIDLIQAYEPNSTRRLPSTVIYNLLKECVRFGTPKEAQYAIHRLVRDGTDLDEGIIVSALNLFSTHGFLDECELLVNQVLPALLQDVPLKEWHLTPLLIAYMAGGHLQEAVSTYERIYQENTREFTPRSGKPVVVAQPNFRAFAEGLKTPEQAIQAVQNLRKMLDKTKHPPPIQLINGILHACQEHTLLDAISEVSSILFQDPSSALAASIDISTFNTLFSACVPPIPSRLFPTLDKNVHESDIERAESLLEHLRSDAFLRLTPNKATYEHLIDIYLYAPHGSQTWELAFDYLEEMKHYNILPSPFVYVGLLTRLLRERDAVQELAQGIAVPPETQESDNDKRIELVLQEMAALGYLGGKDPHARTHSVLSRIIRSRIGLAPLKRVNDQLQGAASDPRRMGRRPPYAHDRMGTR